MLTEGSFHSKLSSSIASEPMLEQTVTTYATNAAVTVAPVVNVIPAKEYTEARIDRRRQQLAACSKRNRMKKKAEYECLQNKLSSLTEQMDQETTRLKLELQKRDEELKLLRSELAVEKICHAESKASADPLFDPQYSYSMETSPNGSRKRSREEVLTEELRKRDKFISAIFQLADALPVNPFKDIDMNLIPMSNNKPYSPSLQFRQQFFKVLSGQTDPQPPENASRLPTDTLPPISERAPVAFHFDVEERDSPSERNENATMCAKVSSSDEMSDLEQLRATLLS